MGRGITGLSPWSIDLIVFYDDLQRLKIPSVAQVGFGDDELVNSIILYGAPVWYKA